MSLDALGSGSPRNASAQDNGQDKLLSEIARVGDYIKQRAHSLACETRVTDAEPKPTQPMMEASFS